jgi:hypothetical protein
VLWDFQMIESHSYKINGYKLSEEMKKIHIGQCMPALFPMQPNVNPFPIAN